MLVSRTISVFALAGVICFSQQSRPPVHRHPFPLPDPVILTSADVALVVQKTAEAVNSDAMVIAVTDGRGTSWRFIKSPRLL